MSDTASEIIRIHEQFAACWSRGDARGTAAFFAQDGVRAGCARRYAGAALRVEGGVRVRHEVLATALGLGHGLR